MFNLEWTAFKAFVDAKSLSIQYASDDSFYYLMAQEGSIFLTCKLNRTLEGDDVYITDFEDNYQSAGNARVHPHLVSDRLPVDGSGVTQPTSEALHSATVLTNQTLNSNNSQDINLNVGTSKEVNIIIRINGSVSGGTPTITFYATDRDALTGNLTNNETTLNTFTGTSTSQVFTHFTKTGSMTLRWVVGGSSPSFGGVYVSVIAMSGTTFSGSGLATEATLSALNTRFNSDIATKNVSNTSGVEGAVSVTNSATAIKVGGSNLSNRKTLTALNNGTQTLYWGYTNSVTTSSGTPLLKGQFASWSVGPSVTVYMIAASSSHNVRVTESS